MGFVGVGGAGRRVPDVNQDERARLTAERDEARREADYQLGEKLAAQMTLKAVTDALALPLAGLGDGWTAATGKILERITEIVDEADRLARERDEARRGVQRLREHHVAERDRLRDALRRARLDVTDVGASGWDSTRLERTKEAVARIDAALAGSEETT